MNYDITPILIIECQVDENDYADAYRASYNCQDPDVPKEDLALVIVSKDDENYDYQQIDLLYQNGLYSVITSLENLGGDNILIIAEPIYKNGKEIPLRHTKRHVDVRGRRLGIQHRNYRNEIYFIEHDLDLHAPPELFVSRVNGARSGRWCTHSKHKDTHDVIPTNQWEIVSSGIGSFVNSGDIECKTEFLVDDAADPNNDDVWAWISILGHGYPHIIGNSLSSSPLHLNFLSNGYRYYESYPYGEHRTLKPQISHFTLKQLFSKVLV